MDKFKNNVRLTGELITKEILVLVFHNVSFNINQFSDYWLALAACLQDLLLLTCIQLYLYALHIWKITSMVNFKSWFKVINFKENQQLQLFNQLTHIKQLLVYNLAVETVNLNMDYCQAMFQ